MPVTVTNYGNVAARAAELGCRFPGGIALLPANFLTARNAAELRYHEAVTSVREAWRSIGLIDAGSECESPQLSPGGRASAGQPVSLTVLFGSGLLSRGAEIVTLALGMVAAVLTERPGNSADSRNVRFDAIVERQGSSGYTCLEYSGDAFELVALAKPVWESWAGLRALDD